MKVFLLLSICTLGIFAGVQQNRVADPLIEDPPIEDPPMEIASLPTITVRQDRSLYDIPEIAITFPDGRQDELILEKHFPNDEARLENEEHCNYFGHLKNDLDACVAVTGCYGRDDLEFTIMSKHVLGPNMFVLEKDGHLRAVVNDKVFLNSQKENEMEMTSRWNDDMREKCEKGECPSMPAAHILKLRFYYENSFLEKTGKDHSKAKNYINQMVAHMQTYFCHSSLGTQLEIRTVGEHKHNDVVWQSTIENLEKAKPLTKDNSGANLWVFLTGIMDLKESAIGWGNVGSVCHEETDDRTSINAVYGGVIGTAMTIAHEVGHNLGMSHDFESKNNPRYFKGESCNHKGLMSYGEKPKEWSKCSRNDFLALYAVYTDSWCLEKTSNIKYCACKDFHADCTSFGKSACSNDKSAFMAKNCRKFCQFCGRCENLEDDEDCKFLAELGQCKKDEAYMKTSCKKACNFC